MKNKDKEAPKNHLYRNISISFIVFAAMILCAIFLFFFSQAAIVITPDSQDINLSFNVEVKAAPTVEELADRDVVGGEISSEEKTASGNLEVLSSKSVSSTDLGSVKIMNTSASAQPLVKTTQLQAENGTIVRTSDSVTVPAGGSVTVAVFPKDPVTFVPIKSGKLTIIKLNPALQEKIFGEVINELSNGPKEVKFVADSDINRAKEEFIKKTTEETKAALGLGDKDPMSIEVTSFETAEKTGDESSAINYTAAYKIKTLKINQDQLSDLIKRKVERLQLKGLTIQQIDSNNVKFTILDPEPGSEAVMVKVDYMIKALLSADNSILDRRNFVGKTLDEVRAYASKSELIKNIEVHISPYWQTRLPSEEGRIKVIVQ